MNTESNGGSFVDIPQQEFFQRFMNGQNLVDSSVSFARLNSKTITERSIRESFTEEQNHIVQQLLASNIRLMEELSKTQTLENQIKQLQNENTKLKVQVQQLQEQNQRMNQELEQMKHNINKEKKLYMPDTKYKNLQDLNKIILNRTESSFQFYKEHMLTNKFSKTHNSHPFVYMTRPQSPQIRQSTPTKDIKQQQSWRECQKNIAEYKKFQKTMEQLLRKPQKK